MTDLDNDLVKLLVGVAVTVAFFAGLSVWGRRRGLELVQRWAGLDRTTYPTLPEILQLQFG